MRELRRFKRVPFREAFHFENEKDVFSGDCVAIDISEGGAQLRIEKFLPLNTEVTLSFRLNNADRLTLDSRVIWIQRIPHAEVYRVGIEFLEGDRNCGPKKCIRQYISN